MNYKFHGARDTIIKRGELKAILYLVSPIRSKEFNADDYNLASIFTDIFNLIDVGGLA